jgi:arsenite methyltransferase
MSHQDNAKIIDSVRENYARIADEGSDCGCNPSSCCGPEADQIVGSASLDLGYNGEELKNLPDGADMGLGCGNPQAIASLVSGETVLDLGSGGGIDCFLASSAVGEDGKIIGVDMTPEMVSKARNNQLKGDYSNVEFRLGEIENLPVADNSINVIISNCVINLSPDKKRVFQEAFRVLKSGGRLAISDIVATAELPDEIKADMALYSGCVAGALHIDKLQQILEHVGYSKIQIQPKDESRKFIDSWIPGTNVADYVLSANIIAYKP